MSAHHHHRPASDNGGHQPGQAPYWKRAHTDWRLWVGVVVMFVAIIIYLASEDLAWRPRAEAPQSQPKAAGDK